MGIMECVEVHGVVFDLDGTLVDSVDAHILSWIKAFESFGVRVDQNSLRQLIGLPGRTIIREVLGTEDEYLYAKIRELKDKLFMELIDSLKLYPHAYVLIRFLRSRGLKVGIATSTPSWIAFKVLDVLHIKDLFDVVIASDMVEKGKPHPEPFLKAFSSMGVDPIHGMVIGDSQYDIIPARAIGSIAILILHGRRIKSLTTEPHYVVNDFIELHRLLERILC